MIYDVYQGTTTCCKQFTVKGDPEKLVHKNMCETSRGELCTLCSTGWMFSSLMYPQQEFLRKPNRSLTLSVRMFLQIHKQKQAPLLSAPTYARCGFCLRSQRCGHFLLRKPQLFVGTDFKSLSGYSPYMAKRSKKHTFSKFVFPYYVRVSCCCCCVCVCLGNCCRLIFDSTSF